MRKTVRKNQGITLIALVITIIVLLILAGVAIAMLSGENGILRKAAEAKTRTDESQANEMGELVDLEILMEESTGNLKNVKDYPKDKKVEGKKVKLQDDNGDTIVIPVGFKIKGDSPTEVKKGIVVVAPDNSEFVWVPVKDSSKMFGVNAEGNKLGKLYNFTEDDKYTANNWVETSGIMSWIDENGNREPDYLLSVSDGDAVTGDNTKGIELLKSIIGLKEENGDILTQWKTQLQNEFNNMAKYVEKNKGFYIGRYETSLNETSKNAQSISGINSATAGSGSANTWYGLYQKEKEYSQQDKLKDVVGSSMIWESQYEQMLIWMLENGIDIISESPTNLEGVKTVSNKTRTTGAEEKDNLNNIYDLLGNSYEWTNMASDTDKRTQVGGCLINENGLFAYGEYSPNLTDVSASSRITLYVK